MEKERGREVGRQAGRKGGWVLWAKLTFWTATTQTIRGGVGQVTELEFSDKHLEEISPLEGSQQGHSLDSCPPNHLSASLPISPHSFLNSLLPFGILEENELCRQTNTNHAFQPPAASLLVTRPLFLFLKWPQCLPQFPPARPEGQTEERRTQFSVRPWASVPPSACLLRKPGAGSAPLLEESAHSEANSLASSPRELWAQSLAMDFINNTAQTAVTIFFPRNGSD